MKKKISIVVPCYNEADSIPLLAEAVGRVMKELPDYDYELLFVDDGSTDGSLQEMIELSEADPHILYFSFSRNFGKEAALYAGFSNASGDYIVAMDADLQDPPSLLPKMVATLETKSYDCVAARRISRKGEPPIRSFFAKLFYKMIRKAADIEIADGARDYQMMTRQMADSILSLKEYHRFSKGIFAWVGYRKTWLTFENVERVAGETKWSFWKLFLYSIEGIINFSNLPLQFASCFGLVMTGVSFVTICIITIRKLCFGDPVAGWPSLACIMTFVGGIQLFFMGIMGQYLSRTYTEVKHRPHYIIRETNHPDTKENN